MAVRVLSPGVPPRRGGTMKDAARFKSATTERWKADLETELRRLGRPFGHRDELELEYSADPMDHVRSAADRDIAIPRLADQTRRVHEVEAALARLEDGSYGLCEQCGDPIASKRLDAAPWVRLCIRCQSQAETRRSFDI